MKMKVSIIIVNYNHKYFPKMAVEALEKSKTNFSFEIIVVDNASRDPESLEFLKKAHEDKRITLICSPKNVGFGAGNNLGAKIATGDFLFFHNPDLKVHEDSLQKMIDYIEKIDNIGVLGPKIIYSNGKIQESCRRHMNFFDLILNRTFLGRLSIFKKRVANYLMQDFDHDKIQNVDLLTGAAMLVPRKVFEKVGGFDKRFFLFMEDFDLCRVIYRFGHRIVYYPNAEVEHYQNRLSSGSIFKIAQKKVFWLHVINALKYFWKWR